MNGVGRGNVRSGSEVMRQCQARLEDSNKMGNQMVEELLCGKMATPPLTSSGIDMSFTAFLYRGHLTANCDIFCVSSMENLYLSFDMCEVYIINFYTLWFN